MVLVPRIYELVVELRNEGMNENEGSKGISVLAMKFKEMF